MNWRCILLSVIFLVSADLYSRSPVPNAYRFGGFDLEELIPFSKQELDSMHRQKIKAVYYTDKIQMPYYTGEDRKFRFIFNAEGQLVKELGMEGDHIGKKSEHWKATDSTMYEYDEAGRLLVKRYHGTCVAVRCDSITYDQQGRLRSYDCYERLRGSKRDKQPPAVDAWYRVYFLRFENGYALMRDTAMGEVKTYYVDENNSCRKIVTEHGRDSISRTCTGTRCLETYWYRQDTAAYKLGQKIVYHDNKVQSIIVYDVLGDIHRDYRYYYDVNGQLIQVINLRNVYYSKYYYSYNEYGIKTEEIYSDHYDIKRKFYYYTY